MTTFTGVKMDSEFTDAGWPRKSSPRPTHTFPRWADRLGFRGRPGSLGNPIPLLIGEILTRTVGADHAWVSVTHACSRSTTEGHLPLNGPAVSRPPRNVGRPAQRVQGVRTCWPVISSRRAGPTSGAAPLDARSTSRVTGASWADRAAENPRQRQRPMPNREPAALLGDLAEALRPPRSPGGERATPQQSRSASAGADPPGPG